MVTLTSAEDLSRFLTIIFVGPIVFIVSLVFLMVVYKERRRSAKTKFTLAFNLELHFWKLEAVEIAISDIETEAPIPLEKIELYSHNHLNQKFSVEFSSLNINNFNIVFPETITIIQELLDEKPLLGTYHPVEQQFIKNFANK
jgi:hypothetical protein